MLRKRITATIHLADFFLKLLQIVFPNLETISRRRNQNLLKYKALKGCSWFSLIEK